MTRSQTYSISKTTIPGLLDIAIPIFGDDRGWFKENYQKAKLEAIGLPEFKILQNNISFNAEIGVTRGIHAEPWDKYISLATGKVFAAIVDLRSGDSFGKVETFELTPGRAIFVPSGCGNSFQTLEPNTAYTYLVNDHWSAEAQAQYTFCNLFDETLAIDWPIPRNKAILSDKDINHPALKDVVPMQANL